MFNLEWYRIFLQTAKAGNLTKAAHALHMTQPSVSYAIKQMENAFGVKLFQRLSKGVELTAEGGALLGYVEQSLTLLDAGEQKMHALKTLAGGELRIGASDSLFKHLLLPVLDAFHAQFQGVRLRLSHGKTPEIMQRIMDGRIDFGFVHLPYSHADPKLHINPLMTVRDCFVAGAAYRQLADQPLSAAELAKLPLLLLSPGSSTRLYVEQWFAAHGLNVEADIELGSFDLLVEFALRGFGAAFVTRSIVAKELAEGTLFELHTAEELPVRSIGIAYRSDISLPLPADRFLELLASSSLKL